MRTGSPYTITFGDWTTRESRRDVTDCSPANLKVTVDGAIHSPAKRDEGDIASLLETLCRVQVDSRLVQGWNPERNQKDKKKCHGSMSGYLFSFSLGAKRKENISFYFGSKLPAAACSCSIEDYLIPNILREEQFRLFHFLYAGVLLKATVST